MIILGWVVLNLVFFINLKLDSAENLFIKIDKALTKYIAE